MKVYREIDGNPTFVGECDVKLPPGPPKFVQTRYRVPPPPVGEWGYDGLSIASAYWEIAAICDPENGIPLGEFVIKLQDSDKPERLPGWRENRTHIHYVSPDKIVPRNFPDRPDIMTAIRAAARSQ